MLTLNQQTLEFRFPDLHPNAGIDISFHRTLRVPDDGNNYPLPSGLGKFPLYHVEDFPKTIPNSEIERGGVILPMYQLEAMWIHFSNQYPCAVKIAAGKVCVITGKEWDNKLENDKQNYIVSTKQPWLHGYRIDEQNVRQFVAMPIGQGYTAEEQMTGQALWGGLQLMVIPLKPQYHNIRVQELPEPFRFLVMTQSKQSMGIAAGGKIAQSIKRDTYDLDCWDMKHSTRCFIHTVNSEHFKSLTGLTPPPSPITAKSYIENNIPWFEHYSEHESIRDDSILSQLKPVSHVYLNNHWDVIPGNTTLPTDNIVPLNKSEDKIKDHE